MRRRPVVVVILAMALVVAGGAAAAPASRKVAIIGATLVDGTGAAPRRDVTILLDENRIAHIGSRLDVEVPAGATRIDAAGRFVVPGLIDSHVHLYNDFYPLFLANGITSIRELGNFERQIFRYRDDARRFHIPAPRLFVAGPILDGPDPTWPGSISLASAEQAKREVARLAAAGVNVLKVYNGLSREILRAVIDEAHARRLPVTGHVPSGIDARDAMLLGMDGIEHLTGVPLYAASRGEVQDRAAVDNRTIARWWLRADQARLEDLAKLSARRRVYHCPTLFLENRWAESTHADLDSDPILRFVDPVYSRRIWVQQVHPDHGSFSREDAADLRAAFPARLAFVGMLARAGAPILAGSDTPNPYVVPGWSLHEELKMLVQAGLTPAQALASATTAPARFLRVDDRLGTVEEGKLADLLVISGDPLADVANLHRIEWVVADGRPHSRGELDAKLEELARNFERGRRLDDASTPRASR